MTLLEKAADLIKNSKKITVFTGAGISVESGIPPFRGEGGLWSEYDPLILDINYFQENSKEAWKAIKRIFYDFWGEAKPNFAHDFVTKLEKKGKVFSIITQNIDNLHQESGSEKVYEFHGTLKRGYCLSCGKNFNMNELNFKKLPVTCTVCGGTIKPDFIFFGEGIPEQAYSMAMNASQESELFLIIGTAGEVMPANQIPIYAKRNGAKIIEINLEESTYTNSITDIFLQGKATEICKELDKLIFEK